MLQSATLATRIEHARVLLRRYEPGDAQSLFDAARESTAEVYPFLEWCHPNYELAESKQWIQQVRDSWYKRISFGFAIFNPSDDQLLGGCGLNEIRAKDMSANLGYWIRTSATRQGLATLATQLVANFGFEQLGLQRIEIIMATTNGASRAVAEKAGAIYEGTQRNKLRLHGAAIPARVYSLIPDDL